MSSKNTTVPSCGSFLLMKYLNCSLHRVERSRGNVSAATEGIIKSLSRTLKKSGSRTAGRTRYNGGGKDRRWKSIVFKSSKGDERWTWGRGFFAVYTPAEPRPLLQRWKNIYNSSADQTVFIASAPFCWLDGNSFLPPWITAEPSSSALHLGPGSIFFFFFTYFIYLLRNFQSKWSYERSARQTTIPFTHFFLPLPAKNSIFFCEQKNIFERIIWAGTIDSTMV
jgi:hypothetical protein